MIGMTLGRYLAVRFLSAVLYVFATCFVLVLIVDFIELVRRAGDTAGVSMMSLALLTLCRTPALTEQIFPFAVLFGSMASFLFLSRRLELVVARAAGISAWQFLSPALVCALGLGLASMMVYNPVSARLKDYSLQLEANLLGKTERASSQEGFWIRQRSMDGQSILHATISTGHGTSLQGVTVHTFDPQGKYKERIEAQSAQLTPGAWALNKATVFSYGAQPHSYESFLLGTTLTQDQVQESLTSPDTVSFWQLPNFIALTKRAGLPAIRYELKYQSLLARPFLLVAMVLISATVSLRFFRLGGMARMILYGVAAGFLLYVVTELAEDLGAAGLVSSGSASWFPAVFGIAMGSLVLLHLEDG